MRERRTFIRIPVNLEATYQAKEGAVPSQLARGIDLSLGGIRLTSAAPLTPGQCLSITFTLPKEGLAVVHGIVVWCQESINGRGGYQAGVRWAEVSPSAQARLNAFVAREVHPAIKPLAPITALESPIRWGRAILTGVLGFTALALAASLWLARSLH